MAQPTNYKSHVKKTRIGTGTSIRTRAAGDEEQSHPSLLQGLFNFENKVAKVDPDSTLVPRVVDASLQLITSKEVQALLRISRSTLFRIQANDLAFPRPIRLSGGTVRFKLVDVREWMQRKLTS